MAHQATSKRPFPVIHADPSFKTLVRNTSNQQYFCGFVGALAVGFFSLFRFERFPEKRAFFRITTVSLALVFPICALMDTYGKLTGLTDNTDLQKRYTHRLDLPDVEIAN